ncbi:MAG: thioredoxin family protein [Bacteroidales bacterium]|nr:thioredoxin family protein [Bacteroidales bacterium]
MNVLMKKLLLSIFSLIIAIGVAAQDVPQIDWSMEIKQTSDSTLQAIITGFIPDNCYSYGLKTYDDGPNPTILDFSASQGVEAEGDLVTVTPPEVIYDEVWGMEIEHFSSEAVFSQNFKIVAPYRIVCNIECSVCEGHSCYPPQREELVSEGGAASSSEEEKSGRKGALWALIIEAILWGFAALLTPCVFPMVPMTVSFFLKGTNSKLKAALYGLFIVLLYTVPIALIILLTRFFGGEAVSVGIFNWIATAWLPNLLFFAIFIFFALSFFGLFNIELPAWMGNKSDGKSGRDSLGGIFFLALTLVLVSFSCTGPIVGSVLIKSIQGEFFVPIVTMLAFSLAFALPFVLLAMFPGLLKSLPKSGGWLDSVKIVIAFIEVALSLKFLSVADQTYHWGILPRSLYLVIWIITFGAMSLYLWGAYKFPHEAPLKKLRPVRIGFATISSAFTICLIAGLFNVLPLKALSGYLPPQKQETVSSGAKYSDFLSFPHGLTGYFTLEEAQTASKAEGKPIFVQFTGHGCVNCREMEARVWSDPQVLDILKNKYILCALYGDDKTKVPEAEWLYKKDGKVLKTLGEINTYVVYQKYGISSQPAYLVIDYKGNVVKDLYSYNLSIKDFIEYLESGCVKF